MHVKIIIIIVVVIIVVAIVGRSLSGLIGRGRKIKRSANRIPCSLRKASFAREVGTDNNDIEWKNT